MWLLTSSVSVGCKLSPQPHTDICPLPPDTKTFHYQLLPEKYKNLSILRLICDKITIWSRGGLCRMLIRVNLSHFRQITTVFKSNSTSRLLAIERHMPKWNVLKFVKGYHVQLKIYLPWYPSLTPLYVVLPKMKSTPCNFYIDMIYKIYDVH